VLYRPPGRAGFPGVIEDGKAAVRWLRGNAARYGLDGDHIGAVGVSSGGYGVCMLGTTGPEDGFEGTEGDPACSSRLQAVVALGAPADFTTRVWADRMDAVYLRPFLEVGYARDPARYARASPGTYATADDPPFLLLHSSEDVTVPVEMARSFAGQLRRAGVSVELVEEEGPEHIWLGAKLDQAIERMIHFFDRHLRP
jgi:acetyl esterase/lipase